MVTFSHIQVMNVSILTKSDTKMPSQIRPRPIKRRTLLFLIPAILLLGVLQATPMVLAASPEKILILPFTIHAEKDMAFLNKGIVSMLASRLYKPGVTTTEAVNDPPTTTKDIQALARSSGARYYTSGSLTLFGSSVSTDAKLIDADTGKVVTAFNQYGERAGDVLAHMDAFARQIIDKFTAPATPKMAPPEAAAPQTPPPSVPLTAATAGAIAGASAAAPQGSAPASSPAPQSLSPPAAPPAAAAPTAVVTAAGIDEFESREFIEEIRSLTTGDIDGDGKTEIIFASAQNVSAVRLEADKLVPAGGFHSSRELPILTVDAADLNGNGVSELFVTRVNETPQSRDPNVRQWGIDSIVLENRNGRLTELVPGMKFYFRGINTPDRGRVIAAQRRGVAGTYGELEAAASKSNTGGLFLGNAFLLDHKDGDYAPGDNILLPSQVAIYDFALGDALNDGSDIITTLAGKGYLTLREISGKKKWSGKERYGGSATYLEFPSLEGTSQMDRYYLRQRLFIVDIDQDGLNEVILVNNFDASRSLASRVRLYKNGNIVCLAWGKRSLIKKWETEEASGFISDLAIADIDADGKKELIYAIVENEKTNFSEGKSYIVIQKPPSSGAGQ